MERLSKNILMINIHRRVLSMEGLNRGDIRMFMYPFLRKSW